MRVSQTRVPGRHLLQAQIHHRILILIQHQEATRNLALQIQAPAQILRGPENAAVSVASQQDGLRRVIQMLHEGGDPDDISTILCFLALYNNIRCSWNAMKRKPVLYGICTG
jgi:hypothetical protein